MTAHRKPLYGVGVNDWLAPTKVMGKPIWNYRVWQSMLERCYSTKFKEKRPTYENTSCDESWHSLSKFTHDIESLDNYEMLDHGWALDKDIIGGLDHYSLDTVCIVPREINNLLITQESSRGGYPIGVSYDKSRCKYLSSMKFEGKTINLGRYDNITEAHNAYVKSKGDYVKHIAIKYQGVLAKNVYEKLMKFSVK